jgi:regulator of sigma E protease
MLGMLWNIAAFIVALGILVAVHEWGHFIVARWCKVKVERFSIGFGKVLYSRFDKHGTEFAVAAIPLGGYVKMLDSRVDDVPTEQRSCAFDHKPVAQRIAIVAAGPMVNFIFAALALMLMYMIGLTTVKPVIGEVVPNSIAATAGVPEQAYITNVAGRETVDWQAVNLELISHIGDPVIPLTVSAMGREQTFLLDTTTWSFSPDTESAFDTLGIIPFRPQPTMTLGMIAPDSAAARANLQIGDKLQQIDGTLFTDWEQIVAYVQARPGQDIELRYERDGMLNSVYMTLGYRDTEQGRIGVMGVNPRFEAWPDGAVFTQAYNPFDALLIGIEKTWRLMTLSVEMLGKLIVGDVSVKTLSGPVAIAQGAGTSASYGVVYFLSFLALISVNLGIINLLPLPMLDGGHLMYFFVEAVRGKPVPEQIQEIGFRIGAVILFTLMAIAITNDIMRLS